MKKRILTEMAIYDEDEVFSLQPVADVTTTGLEQLEGSDFINHIVKTIDTSNLPEDYVLSNRELNEIYSHHCAYRILKKAAFLALPQILQAKLVLSSWKKKTVQDGSKSNDNRVSGLMGAPITIDNVKYLCLVGMRKNRNKIITPYTITLKDANGVIVGDKKVNSDIIVPDSNNGTSAFGSTHLSTDTASLDANSPSNANIDKNNKTEKNESKNMTKKNTIRLTESDLKKVISESVKKVLREIYEDESNNFGERVKDIMRCVLHDIKTAESRLYSIANSRNKGIHEDDDTMAAYNVLHDCISIFRKNGFDLNVMNGRGTRSSEILRNTGMSRAEALRQKEDEDYWNDGGDISY